MVVAFLNRVRCRWLLINSFQSLPPGSLFIRPVRITLRTLVNRPILSVHPGPDSVVVPQHFMHVESEEVVDNREDSHDDEEVARVH